MARGEVRLPGAGLFVLGDLLVPDLRLFDEMRSSRLHGLGSAFFGIHLCVRGGGATAVQAPCGAAGSGLQCIVGSDAETPSLRCAAESKTYGVPGAAHAAYTAVPRLSLHYVIDILDTNNAVDATNKLL